MKLRPFLMYLFLLRLLADVGEDTTINIKHMAIYGVRSMRCEEHGGTTQF